jgi:small subunit ribosomal protein S6
MRKYLLTLVLKPESDRKAALDEIKEVLSFVEGKIESEEELATKKLAYEIQKTREGVFLLLRLSGTGELPARLIEVLRISDYPLRFMITSEAAPLKRGLTSAALPNGEAEKKTSVVQRENNTKKVSGKDSRR